MLPIFTLMLSKLLAVVIAADIVPSLQSSAPFVQSLASPTSQFDLNTPFPAVDVSTPENIMKIECNGTRFGSNPKVKNCKNIFTYADTREVQHTFSQRRSGTESNVHLPWRLYDDKGLCFIQIVLKSGATSAIASPLNITRAAATILHECVIKRGVGGLAGEIGGDNNLLVAVAKYDPPKVQCDPSPPAGPPPRSCIHVWSEMDAGQEIQVFGREGGPGVQVDLPRAFYAIDARCALTIDIGNEPTLASWYEIWAATVAVASMCTRALGKGGKARGLGLRKNIFIHLYDNNPDMGHSTGTTTHDNSSFSAAWSESNVQNSSLAASSSDLPSEPFELSSSLGPDDSTLLTLASESLMNISADALA